MNIKELIEKYEYLNHNFFRRVDTSEVLRDLKQLDESQKVVVPQFVADWYEEHKKDLGYSIWNYIYYWDQQEGYDFKDWFDYGCCGTIQTLFNMHQFGYEVEKEKRYLVKVKGMKCVNGCLAINKKLAIWFFGTSGNSNNYRTHHTRKELEEAGFGWVFDCEGIEVNEVTE